MEFEANPDSEKGAFNAAIQYLITLTTIEREIISARLSDDFKTQDNLLDSYDILLDEWLDKKPKVREEHIALRKKQKEAYQRIRAAISKRQMNVSTADLETFNDRFRRLLKTYHDLGLRMPKKDDPAFALSGSNY